MYKIIICAIIKDEHDYIEEWVEYHHNYVGIEHIYLIEDINSKPHDKLLSKYDYVTLTKFKDDIKLIDKEQVEKFKFDKVFLAYLIFHKFHRKKAEWISYIDVDEFMIIDKEKLYKLLDSQKNKPCISMQWLNMKCDGYLKHPNNGQKYSLLNTYHTFAIGSKIYNELTKQIINCDDKFEDITKLEKWYWFPHSINFIINNFAGNIKLKHFICKSFEEYVNKLCKRGICASEEAYHRYFSGWFDINPEYIDKQEELYKEYNIKFDDDSVKYSYFNF